MTKGNIHVTVMVTKQDTHTHIYAIPVIENIIGRNMLLGGYFYNLEVMIFSLVSILSNFSDFLQPTCITLLKTGKTSLKNSK